MTEIESRQVFKMALWFADKSRDNREVPRISDIWKPNEYFDWLKVLVVAYCKSIIIILTVMSVFFLCSITLAMMIYIKVGFALYFANKGSMHHLVRAPVSSSTNRFWCVDLCCHSHRIEVWSVKASRLRSNQLSVTGHPWRRTSYCYRLCLKNKNPGMQPNHKSNKISPNVPKSAQVWLVKAAPWSNKTAWSAFSTITSW